MKMFRQVKNMARIKAGVKVKDKLQKGGLAGTSMKFEFRQAGRNWIYTVEKRT
jgi:hypothetical protein